MAVGGPCYRLFPAGHCPSCSNMMSRISLNRKIRSREANSDLEGVGQMSRIMGDKISLHLVRPHRYRVHYHILLEDQAIGEIELDHIAWRSGEAELKITISESKWHNHGLGTDAVTTLLGQAFVKMNLNRVYLRVQVSNGIALRCYEKAGFKKEGRLRRFTEQGTEEEIFLMGITKAQFLRQTHPWAV